MSSSSSVIVDAQKTKAFVDHQWDSSIVPALKEYITIPNQSPAFDKEWETNGYVDSAVKLMTEWVGACKVPTLQMEVLKEKGKTPLIFMTIDPTTPGPAKTILMYGHLDKQPPMDAPGQWRQGLGPYTPVIENGRLYGRGGADDGYAIFAAITTIRALKEQNIPHSRIVIVIEACEESGSPDLPHYMEVLKSRIGTPSLVVCLDSGCGNYDQFFTTTSLRGIAAGVLTVKVLKEGVHSGHASGIAASSFRVLRNMLDRIEDPTTGEFRIKEFSTVIPPNRVQEAAVCAKFLGKEIWHELPFVEGAGPVTENLQELLLNRAWRPTLCVVGCDGFPEFEKAGNVLRSHTRVKISCRVPPRVDCNTALAALTKTLTENQPKEAKVEFTNGMAASGWEAPPTAPWLEKAMLAASTTFYNGLPNVAIGEGGSIPFMKMLHDKFPQAQFVITGVLGPQSNAHGPNEFIDIEYAKKVNCCVAAIVAVASQESSI